MIELTPTQKRCLDMLKQYISDKGYPPSSRELSVLMGFSSQGARTHLWALEQKNYIERDVGVSRGIRIIEPKIKYVKEDFFSDEEYARYLKESNIPGKTFRMKLYMDNKIREAV